MKNVRLEDSVKMVTLGIILMVVLVLFPPIDTVTIVLGIMFVAIFITSVIIFIDTLISNNEDGDNEEWRIKDKRIR